MKKNKFSLTNSLKSVILKFAAFLISIIPKKILNSKKLFCLLEEKGYHLTPNHYLYPIPDTRTLSDNLWTKHKDPVGINFEEAKQIDLLRLFSKNYQREYDNFPSKKGSDLTRYYLDNGAFESVDGEIYYCMIRYFKPERIIEIGSGNSTCLAAQAILTNHKENKLINCDLAAFDPYPNKIILKGFPGLSKLFVSKAEKIPLTTFKKLKENDILFIDSTHIVEIGRDVNYLILEILPRLNKGVIVHFHDIFLPAEYPKPLVLNGLAFWSEQYLLQAFMTYNRNFQILWAGSFMHLKHPEILEKYINSYKRNKRWPGSFWIRKVR